MNIYVLFVGIVIVSALIQPVIGECNRLDGPSGILECFSSPYYGGKYQWGTCLTDAYIQQRSKGSHSCRDTTATFCYYQCMIEQHELDQGPVYDDCSCRPGDAAPSTEAPIAAWCYSPDGTECSWYRSCLEKRYPCTGTGTSYALDYGEKFCNLYTKHYSSFDEIAQQWIDAVRKCLQVALVPLLRPYNHPSCDEIKNAAFGSHSGCYMNPYPGASSFCDIGWSNFWKVVWTIKPAFLSDFWATVGQGLETGFGCIRNKVSEKVHMLKVFAERLVDTLGNIIVEKIEQAITNYIIKIMRNVKLPNQYPIQLYIYEDSSLQKRSTYPSNSTVFNVLLFDRKKYDLNYESVSNISIDDVKTQMMDDIETGQFQLNIGAPIERISLCQYMECLNATRTVVPGTPGPAEKSTGLAVGAIIGIVVGVVIGLVVIGTLVFFFIRKM